MSTYCLYILVSVTVTQLQIFVVTVTLVTDLCSVSNSDLVANLHINSDLVRDICSDIKSDLVTLQITWF